MYLMQDRVCYKRVDSAFQTTNLFTRALPLRTVRWEVALVKQHNVQGYTDHMTYVRAGVPEDAELLDVSLEIGTAPDLTNIVYIYAHPSFDLVQPGATIPHAPIVLVDVRSVLRAIEA